MALIKFGAGIIQMLGSVGGTTFARNPYGNYARARTKPIDKNTPLQQKVRSSLSMLTTIWSQFLSPEQRKSWDDYAAGQVMSNRLGEACYLSGFNHYIRSNMLLKQSNLPLVDDGPVIHELPAMDDTLAIEASEIGEFIDVFYNNGMDWASEYGSYMFLFQGMPMNAARNFFAGPWRLLGKVGGIDGNPPASPANFVTVYTTTAGQHQWVYARIIRKDGRLSQRFRADCFVEA